MLPSILPQKGYLCVCEQVAIKEKSTFKNYWFDSADDALRWSLKLDAAGKTAFIAQASFLKMGEEWTGRAGSGAAYFRNFFLDIDCGEGKPYPTQTKGLKALASFCKVSSLPFPAVVSSGNGLYAHWVLDSDLPASLWYGVAQLFQKVVKHYAPDLDVDGLSTDRARVLRPVGVTHRKDADNPKPVRLIKDCEPINTGNMCRLIKLAFEATGEKLAVPKKQSIVTNAEFLSGLNDYPPSSAEKISEKCAQIAHLKSVKGDVAEPYWYAMVALMRHCVEGSELIHEWSSGHGDYRRETTDSKILQLERNSIGPSTCARFSDCNPDLCKGCQYAGQLTSPITLGVVAPAPLMVTEESRVVDAENPVVTPQGWLMSDKGTFYVGEDVPVKFYDYPVYVSSVNMDHHGESFTLRHRMPFEGWQEVTMATSKLHKADTFFPVIMDAHILVTGKEEKGLFMAYVSTFMSELKKRHRCNKLSGQMGWYREDDGYAFIHGDSIYRKDGSIQNVGYSVSAPEFVKSIKPHGDMTDWVKQTALLNQDGLEGLAFEFICTAFGSPLVKFSGYEGAMLSVVGGSGLGKTLTGKWGLSAWGDPLKMLINQDDTQNVTVGRLGTYNTLPAYIDEVSNITPENLSHLAYRITQGRDKVRMDRNAKERSNINTWNLLATVSSNHSLMDKLLTLKGDPGPEFNRIFEYEIGENNGFTREEGKIVFDAVSQGYGQVGRDYAMWLVQNQDTHTKALNMYTELLAKKAGAKADERFWVMTGAVAVYGATIARRLGLSHVDIERLVPWIVTQIKEMRKYKEAEGFDAVSFMGNLLDKYSSSVLRVASYDPHNTQIQQGYLEPRIKLVARVELDKKMLWISAETIRFELSKMHLSVRKVAALLHGKGLIKTSGRVTLGRGTVHEGIAQTVWTFDLTHPELVNRGLRLVTEINEEDSADVPF